MNNKDLVCINCLFGDCVCYDKNDDVALYSDERLAAELYSDRRDDFIEKLELSIGCMVAGLMIAKFPAEDKHLWIKEEKIDPIETTIELLDIKKMEVEVKEDIEETKIEEFFDHDVKMEESHGLSVMGDFVDDNIVFPWENGGSGCSSFSDGKVSEDSVIEKERCPSLFESMLYNDNVKNLPWFIFNDRNKDVSIFEKGKVYEDFKSASVVVSNGKSKFLDEIIEIGKKKWCSFLKKIPILIAMEEEKLLLSLCSDGHINGESDIYYGVSSYADDSVLMSSEQLLIKIPGEFHSPNIYFYKFFSSAKRIRKAWGCVQNIYSSTGAQENVMPENIEKWVMGVRKGYVGSFDIRLECNASNRNLTGRDFCDMIVLHDGISKCIPFVTSLYVGKVLINEDLSEYHTAWFGSGVYKTWNDDKNFAFSCTESAGFLDVVTLFGNFDISKIKMRVLFEGGCRPYNSSWEVFSPSNGLSHCCYGYVAFGSDVLWRSIRGENHKWKILSDRYR